MQLREPGVRRNRVHSPRDANLVLLQACLELPTNGAERGRALQRQHDLQLRVLWSHGRLSEWTMDVAVRLRVADDVRIVSETE